MGSLLSAPMPPPKPRDDQCAICRQPRARQGEHRGVALPCGHGFGHSCVVRRLRGGGRCPQCGVRASVSQLRPAPGRPSAAGSASGEDAAGGQAELRRERLERRRLERALSETRQRLQKRDGVVRMLQAELSKLQRRVKLEESDWEADSNVSWSPRANEMGDVTE